jgi:hydroxyacylglutathione hydrolase
LSFEIITIVNGPWKVNCYLLFKPSGDSILIDPGSGEDQIVKIVENQNFKVNGIVNTHGHFDHIFSIFSLKKKLNTDFYLHSHDEKLLRRANLYNTLFGSTELIKIPKVDYYLDKISMPLKLGKFIIEVIHTPGHTEGSVCLLIDDYLFTGDLLFKEDIGRIDLPGGNSVKMKQSLKKIVQLSPELKLLPGHGKSATLGNVLINNSKLTRAIS